LFLPLPKATPAEEGADEHCQYTLPVITHQQHTRGLFRYLSAMAEDYAEATRGTQARAFIGDFGASEADLHEVVENLKTVAEMYE